MGASYELLAIEEEFADLFGEIGPIQEFRRRKDAHMREWQERPQARRFIRSSVGSCCGLGSRRGSKKGNIATHSLLDFNDSDHTSCQACIEATSQHDDAGVSRAEAVLHFAWFVCARMRVYAYVCALISVL